MSEQPYAVAHLTDLPIVPGSGTDEGEWRPVRHHFGIAAFGVNAWTGRNAGDPVIEEHAEKGGGGVATTTGHEELYVVTSGRAAFTIDGDNVDAPAGTFVFVRAGVQRVAVAAEPETTVLAIGGAPGEPFAVSPWEERYTRGLVAG